MRPGLGAENPYICKLAVKLIKFQIVAVCDNDSRAIQCLLKKMRIKDHRQRFPAALCMPENTALTVGDGCFLCRSDCLSNSEILMVSCQYLELLDPFIGEADKILNDVEQASANEHPPKKMYQTGHTAYFRNCHLSFSIP